ncbi:hypothetical protein OIDMADRAFT_32182 [Oidiodendron maius Zn]|uniref:DUF7136 domain-containing protein n=1 Tax=Oidiodendron maius (strain Zn) TaxID=913774 RepID=A0A0C3D5J6_OIDMZ|nr:hypothetical protein OIDMADRAFT_32182 [Oidiodendron maius Zn]
MLLACLISLILLLLACGSAAQTYPATVEFDVVFPLNDTYAPVPFFPIVFAIQNPQAAVPLLLNIEWSLERLGSTGGLLTGGLVDLTWANFSTDPYFVVLGTSYLSSIEGSYSVLWTLYSGNCSGSFGGFAKPGLSIASNYTRFTIKNGAQQPSLVTSPDTCPAQNVTFNITGTLPILDPIEYNNRDACAVISEPPPPANPCAIQVAMASSMSAYLSCITAPPAWSSNCTAPMNSSSLAVRSSFGGMGLTGVAAGAWLSLLFWVL